MRLIFGSLVVFMLLATGCNSEKTNRLEAENQRLAQYQAMYKAAEEQISDMRAKLEAASRTPRTEAEAPLPPDIPGSSMKH